MNTKTSSSTSSRSRSKQVPRESTGQGDGSSRAPAEQTAVGSCPAESPRSRFPRFVHDVGKLRNNDPPHRQFDRGARAGHHQDHQPVHQSAQGPAE